MKRLVWMVCAAAMLNACATSAVPPPPSSSAYLDYSGISTPKGTFKVWTKRTGNSPTMKVLVGHGGLGATHEYMEAFDSDFPAYDQKVYFDGVVKFVRDVDQGRL